MPPVSVVISFQAADITEANDVIASWSLSPGCTVNASMIAPVGPSPGTTDSGGAIVEMVPADRRAGNDSPAGLGEAGTA